MAANLKASYVCNYDIYLRKPLTSSRGEVWLATRVVVDFTRPFQHYNHHIILTTFSCTLVNSRGAVAMWNICLWNITYNRYPDRFKVKKGGRKKGIKCKRRQLQKDTILLSYGMMRFSPTTAQMGKFTMQRCIKTAPRVEEVQIQGPVHLYNCSMGRVPMSIISPI